MAAHRGGGAADAPDGVATREPDGDRTVPFNTRYRDFGGRWPVPGDNEILFVPLGGVGRIGMNWTLYGHAGKWLLVDAGIAFAGRDAEDVDAYVPDPAFLAPIRDRLVGLVVTHAHEDHIGAIDRLWPSAIDIPIHASPFAAAVLRARLDEAGTLGAVDLREFRVGGRVAVGPFDVRTVRMTHSIPEPVSLAIRTAAGTVFHSGDWKLDAEPLVGLPSDLDALREIGDEGVLAVMADSTNAISEKPPSSEGEVRAALERIMAARTGMVVVAAFATNVARVASAAVAADRAGRQVALAGRSMLRCEGAARALGLLPGVPEFLSEPGHLRGLDRREMALVCTGTQGEERAALARLARGDRRLPLLEPGDTVVLSSRVVPGNEPEVEEVVRSLRGRGVEVVRGGDHVDGFPVHVSGHASRDDLRTMYGLLRPRFAVPVHGTPEHLDAHARLARGCGVEAAVITEEGEVVRVARDGVRVLGAIEAPMLPLADRMAGRKAGRQRGKALAA